MVQPFAGAVTAYLAGPGSCEAIYQPGEGAPFTLRIMLLTGSDDARFGDGRVRQRIRVVEFAAADVPAPAEADLIIIGGELVDDEAVGGEVLAFYGEPELDDEEVTWSCALKAVA